MVLLKWLVSLQVPACRYRCSQRAIGLLRPVFDLDLGILERDLIHRNASFSLAACLIGGHEHIGQGVSQEFPPIPPACCPTACQDGRLEVSTLHARQEQLRAGPAHVHDDVEVLKVCLTRSRTAAGARGTLLTRAPRERSSLYLLAVLGVAALSLDPVDLEE